MKNLKFPNDPTEIFVEGIHNAKTIGDLASLVLYHAQVAGPIFGLDAHVSTHKINIHFSLVVDVIQLIIIADDYPLGIADPKYWGYLLLARNTYQKWVSQRSIPQKLVWELFIKFIDQRIFDDSIIEGARDLYEPEIELSLPKNKEISNNLDGGER